MFKLQEIVVQEIPIGCHVMEIKVRGLSYWWQSVLGRDRVCFVVKWRRRRNAVGVVFSLAVRWKCVTSGVSARIHGNNNYYYTAGIVRN